jgi:hypothetical protein
VACTTNGAEKVKTLLSLKKRTFILCLLSNKQIRRLPPSSSKSFIHNVAMPSGGALEAMASRHHLLSPVIEWFSAVPVVFRRSELLFLTDLFWTIEASLSHGFVLLPEFPVVLWVSLCLYCVCVVLGFVLGSVFCSHSVFLFVCVYCVISIWCCVLQFFVNLVLCVLCFVFVCACVPDFILLLLIYFFNVGWLCRWFGLECWLVLLAMDVRWGGRGVWSC